MKSKTGDIDRRPLRVFALMFLLTWGWFAALMCAQSLRQHAVTRAVVVDADGLSSLQYQYTYTIAGQTCRQTVDQEPPLPKTGAEIEIHYDPNNSCDSSTFDPGLWGLVIGLAWMSAFVRFIVWVWPWKGPD